MNEADGYRRAKHDVSNRLQLLTAYIEMKKYDAAEAVVKEWSASLRNEQAFLTLDWPLFVEAVLRVKIMDYHYKWCFHIDVHRVERHDELVYQAFEQWMSWLKDQEEEQRTIDVCVKEDSLAWQVEFAVSGQTKPPNVDANMQWVEKNNGRAARLVLKK